MLTIGVVAQKPVKRVKDRATKRTEAKASDRIDQKIDQGVDKVFNGIEGLFSKKKNKNSAEEGTEDTDTLASAEPGNGEEGAGAMGKLFGLDNNEPFEAYQNPVTFSLVMQVSETKKNGKVNESNISFAAIPNRFAMVVSDDGEQSSRMILNTEDGKTTVISTGKNGERSGVRMRMPNFGKRVADAVAEMPDYITVTETGERKAIDGYHCEKYIVTDSKHNTTTVSWITRDLDLTPADVFSGMAGMGGAKSIQIPESPIEGFPIFSTTEDGKTTTTMHFADIKFDGDVDRALFDVEGITIQEVGF